MRCCSLYTSLGNDVTCVRDEKIRSIAALTFFHVKIGMEILTSSILVYDVINLFRRKCLLLYSMPRTEPWTSVFSSPCQGYDMSSHATEEEERWGSRRLLQVSYDNETEPPSKNCTEPGKTGTHLASITVLLWNWFGEVQKRKVGSYAGVMFLCLHYIYQVARWNDRLPCWVILQICNSDRDDSNIKTSFQKQGPETLLLCQGKVS